MRAKTTAAALLALFLLAAAPYVPLAGLLDDPGTSPASDSFVVGFHALPPGLAPGALLFGSVVSRVDPGLRFAAVEGLDAEGLRQALMDPAVRYAEPNPRLPLLQLAPDDARYGEQYGLPQVGAPEAWDATTGGASVRLCIADTGLRHTHEDLASRYGGGIDLVNGDADPWDDHGHGTHVSGIAAAALGNGAGVAGMAQVTLLHAKVLDASGYAPWDLVASGIRWCADEGAHVISLSLAGSAANTAATDAVNYAARAGALVVAAAGNRGPCGSCVLFPARLEGVVAVACTTPEKRRCDFSSSGPEVDLAAPGLGVLSSRFESDTAYGAMSGTSMSTPFVAGAAALLKSHRPEATADEIRAALTRYAEDLGDLGADPEFGAGLLRVDLALAGLSPSGPDEGEVPVFKESFTDTFRVFAIPVSLVPFTLAPPPPRPLLDEEWTQSSATDLWHVERDCPATAGNGPSLAWTRSGTCTYEGGGRLVHWIQSPTLDLAGATEATLSFRHRFDIEQNDYVVRDKLLVQASPDGSRWVTLAQWDSRAGDVTAWSTVAFDLDVFTGAPVSIRWAADTVDAQSNAASGWYLDDVLVTATK